MKTERTPVNLPDLSAKRAALVVARFYPELADWLESGAKQALHDCGLQEKALAMYQVAGCFELPIAAGRLIAADAELDLVVALGVVIRGETPHFDFVAGECARGIMNVQLSTGVPIGFGVLTTETLAQAQERSDPKRGNKGYEAAIAAAQIVHIPREMDKPPAGFRR